MEKARVWEQERLINELNLGRGLAKQLKNLLDPLASPESCESLIQEILCSYEKALYLLNLGALAGELRPVDGMLETPQSFAGSISPRSDASDRSDLKEQYCLKDVYKKRKTLPRWTKQVRVCSGTGLSPVDDGHSWRKYGQKDILGAAFPRAYYRCTHRHAQGCLATKQVQKSDEDPSIFEITYQGRHTCVSTPQLTPGFVSILNQGPKQNKNQTQQEEENPNQSQGMFHFGADRKVKTSSSFPSTPNIESESVEANIFPESLKEQNFLGGNSPGFLSPETSESNYFPLFPSQMDNSELIQHLRHLEFDLTETISAPTSVANSPNADWSLSLDKVDFDPNFSFDASEFFS